MEKLKPFAAIGVLIFINTLVVAYFMRPTIPTYKPYNDTALMKELDSIKANMSKEIDLLHVHIDSLTNTLVEKNNEIERKVKSINSLKNKIDEIHKNIDYSNMSNDSLHNELTNNIE